MKVHTDESMTGHRFFAPCGRFSYDLSDALLLTDSQAGQTRYIHLGKELIAKNGVTSEPTDSPGYTSHLQDHDLSLTYMQQRYYDPVIGRFYSNDPVDMLGHMQKGNPTMGFNRYAYANNNPYKYTDPDGQFIAILLSPPAIAAMEYTATALVGIMGGVAIHENVVKPLMNESANSPENAAQGLPDLTGVDGEAAEEILGDNGFGKTKTTKGGYEQWDHKDGSQVWVRPDGEVVRTGPKRPQQDNPNGKQVRDRYGPDGQKIPHEPGKDNHNTGEKINR